MSDIIECPDEDAVDAVVGYLSERLPEAISRMNVQRPDSARIVMPKIYEGYREPLLEQNFPYISVWTQQDDFDFSQRNFDRGDITVRCMLAIKEAPPVPRRKMYRYMSCILNIIQRSSTLKDADGLDRVGRCRVVQHRYYTPTMSEGRGYELFVGEAYLEIQQEVYRR